MSPPQTRATLLLGFALVSIATGVILVGSRGGSDPPPESARAASLSGTRITVQVLNAGGVDGLAREATGHLRDAGFDVVEYGDAPSWDRDSTLVVDRIGRPAAARAVADALGITNVRSDLDPDLFVDVTVLLGREWTPPGPTGGGEISAQRPWWDLRSWLDR